MRQVVAVVVLASVLSACADGSPAGDAGSTGVMASTGAETSIGQTTVDTAGSSSGEDDTGTASGSTGDPIDPPPPCGSLDYGWRGVVPGPGEPDHDAELEGAAARHDRVHTALTGLPLGLAGDVSIAAADDASRTAIEAFVDSGAWDFEARSGMSPLDVIATWHKATGAFAGVAAAADAYRYGTLRDQGYACEEIDRAREELVRALDGLHLVTELTGVPGLVVRAIAHRDFPGASETATTPIFDPQGDPLPAEKTNGTWREDASGLHPELVWEDSASRDQLIGWAVGYGAAWEVVRDDASIDPALKDRLQADAGAIAEQLMTVRPSGYDLEIWDPEGRPTLHGYLHENNIEGNYLGLLNGQHAIMAAGIIAALAFVAEDPEIDAYLEGELIARRNLMGIAAQSLLIDFGAGTNHSNYNMAFSGAFLVSRYLDDAGGRAQLALAMDRLYVNARSDYPASESAQAFYDLVFALVAADASAFAPTPLPPDDSALAQALATLQAFPPSPAWDESRANCDEAEISAGACTLDDGQVVAVLGMVGHNDALVVADPVPMAVRPPSNFYWRSNPYQPNGGGDGTGLYSASDFRFVYWAGRYARRP